MPQCLRPKPRVRLRFPHRPVCGTRRRPRTVRSSAHRASGPRISSLENRMAGLENALTSIMQHLRDHGKSEVSRAVKSLECPSVLASHAAGDPSADCQYSHDVSTSPQTSKERIKFQKLVQQFSQELQTIQSQTTINSKRTDVIEVFCGPDS